MGEWHDFTSSLSQSKEVKVQLTVSAERLLLSPRRLWCSLPFRERGCSADGRKDVEEMHQSRSSCCAERRWQLHGRYFGSLQHAWDNNRLVWRSAWGLERFRCIQTSLPSQQWHSKHFGFADRGCDAAVGFSLLRNASLDFVNALQMLAELHF